MQLDIAYHIEKHLGRERLLHRHQELAGLGISQLSPLDSLEQHDLLVEAAVQPAVDHVAVVLVSPDQQSGQSGQDEYELQHGIEMEGVMKNVKHRGDDQQENGHQSVVALDGQIAFATLSKTDGEHQTGSHDGAAAHVDQSHLKAAEQHGPNTQRLAEHQIENVLQDGEATSHRRTADYAVDEEHYLLPAGQQEQRNSLHNLFQQGIEKVRHRHRDECVQQPEQTEADQCRTHACSHQQQKPLHAQQREGVQLIHYKNVDSYREKGSNERHYRSLREIINSLLWRPLTKPSGANRWA